MFILSIKFKSSLTYDELVQVAQERLPKFKTLPELIQKYYGCDLETGEYTGIYIWESEQALHEYRKSELARTIPAAYKIDGKPRVEIFEVPFMLRS